MGGPGMGGSAENAKPDFRDPYKATNSFLAALKKKDPALLADAVARRSPTEAKPQHQKMFEAILEQNLAPDQLDELARQFDGMQAIPTNAAMTETGKYSVRVGKREGREVLERNLTIRKEKAGWKVLDFDAQKKYIPAGSGMPNRTGTGRRR
jgi:hypothetical protein